MNITYLIGAGASYNALPILNELPERLKAFKFNIANAKRHFIEEQEHRLCDEVSNDLTWLIGQTGNHQTIDTFARKLFLNSEYHSDLKRLKRLLTIYFLYEQIIHSKNLRTKDGNPISKELPDKRYDSFIASLLRNKINKYELNGNVKILSWNYDSQIELAFQKFNGRGVSFDNVQHHLQVIPAKWVLAEKVDFGKIAILKLNGMANLYINQNEHFFDLFKITNSNSENGVYKFLLNKYDDLRNNKIEASIQYSWESSASEYFKNAYSDILSENIKRIANETDVLVVIGYSFPIFNREIDKSIIESMINLKKVYIQDIIPDRILSVMKSSFKRLQPRQTKNDPPDVTFEQDSNVDSFLLPPELN